MAAIYTVRDLARAALREHTWEGGRVRFEELGVPKTAVTSYQTLTGSRVPKCIRRLP